MLDFSLCILMKIAYRRKYVGRTSLLIRGTALWFLPHGWCGARVPDSEVMLAVEFKHYYIFATKLIATMWLETAMGNFIISDFLERFVLSCIN